MKLKGANASVGGSAFHAGYQERVGPLKTSEDGMVDVAEMQVGEYTGSGGLLQAIPLDFIPTNVEVYDQTTGGVSCVGINSANAAGSSWKLKSGTQTFAPQCIIFTAGVKGFSIGTDADLNKSGDVYSYVAYGS